MRVVRDWIRNPENEPQWDLVGIDAVDFRPHFDGDAVNVFSCVCPASTRSEMERILGDYLQEMASWILDNHAEFGAGDKFQFILAWPISIRQRSRQIIKMGGDFDAVAKIANGSTQIVLRPGWDLGIFNERTA